MKLQRCIDKNGHIVLFIKANPYNEQNQTRDATSVDSDESRIPEEPISKPPAVPQTNSMASMWIKSEPTAVPPVVVEMKKELSSSDASKEDITPQILIKKENASIVSEKAQKQDINPKTKKSEKNILDAPKYASMVAKVSPVKSPSIFKSPKKDENLSFNVNKNFQIDDFKDFSQSDLLKQLEKLEFERQNLLKQVQRCEKDLQEQIQQNLSDRESHEVINKELRETIKTIDTKNSELLEHSNLLEKTLKKEIEASTQMGSEMKIMSDKLNILTKYKTDLDAQLAQLTSDLAKVNSHNETLQKQKNEYETQLENIRMELIKTNAEKDANQKLLENMRKKLGDFLNDSAVFF